MRYIKLCFDCMYCFTLGCFAAAGFMSLVANVKRCIDVSKREEP